LGAAEEVGIDVWNSISHRGWATKGTERPEGDHEKTPGASSDLVLRFLCFLRPSRKFDLRVQWKIDMDLA